MTDFVFRNIDNSAGSATISDRGAICCAGGR